MRVDHVFMHIGHRVSPGSLRCENMFGKGSLGVIFAVRMGLRGEMQRWLEHCAVQMIGPSSMAGHGFVSYLERPVLIRC